LIDASKVRFTKHAIEKFKLLEGYGFEVKEKQVIEAVLSPERIDEKEGQFLATRTINSKHAIRVVYEVRKGFLVIITFYPVRRERFGL
jgi:hypothetical protein